LRGGTPGPSPDAAQDQPAPEDHSPEPDPNAPPAWAPPTDAEEERRRYQSIRNKEQAAEQRAAHQTAQQQVAAEVNRLEAEKDQLLATHEDWEVGDDVAKLDRQIKAVKDGTQQQQSEDQLLGGITAFYDQVWGDTYLAALPVSERERILKTEYHGPDGRRQMAEEVRKSLLAEGGRQERTKLEKNAGYRKQLAHEFGLAREEPDTTPSVAGSAPAANDMNGWIRRAAGR